MNTKFLSELNGIAKSIEGILEKYSKSELLQNYFFDMLNSLLYTNLISNFFENLTEENLREFKIEKQRSEEISNELKNLQNKVKPALSDAFNNEFITLKDYKKFKDIIRKKYPEFEKIILEIEKEIDLKKTSEHIQKKREAFEKCGVIEPNLDTTIITNAIETCVKLEHRFPSESDKSMLSKILSEDLIKEFAKNMKQNLKKDTKRMLSEQRKYQKDFEKRLEKTWKEPIDLLESMIRISTEAVQDKEKRNSKRTEEFKKSALIQIHARGLQIATEILTLIKGGYADGANARWRSLLELSVISFFLRDNEDEISLRYLEFDTVKKLKEASDFQRYHQLLGEDPLEKKILEDLKKEISNLISKYGKEYVSSEYGWIPQNIIKKPTFRKLAAKVKLDKFYPYYNFASNAIHGGSRGFYRLGMMSDFQNKVMVVGATNYGLADPIQNTAITLSHITGNLLTLDPDFESLIITFTISLYVNEIGVSAVGIQKDLEQEYKKNSDLQGYFI